MSCEWNDGTVEHERWVERGYAVSAGLTQVDEINVTDGTVTLLRGDVAVMVSLDTEGEIGQPDWQPAVSFEVPIEVARAGIPALTAVTPVRMELLRSAIAELVDIYDTAVAK